MEREELVARIAICIGAHWPADFVPEEDLTEAVNEFLRLPHPEAFLQLISEGEVTLHVGKVKKDGCWLSFGKG